MPASAMTFGDLLTYAFALFPFLILCSVGPGLFFVRWLRFNPAETLAASVAASLTLIYLLSMAIFSLNPAPETMLELHWGISALCIGLSLFCWRDALTLLRSVHLRHILLAFVFLGFLTLLELLVIREYGGGTWSSDWIEHYQRSLYFLKRTDLQYRFLGQYLLTDRPPLMNLVAAHYLVQIHASFEIYELTAAFLNLLPILPCCLFASSLVRHASSRKFVVRLLMLLLATGPMFMQNVTYVWTKSCAAFFALLALWFYVRGWRKSDSRRIIAAFLVAAAGCLVHFYVVATTAVLALHYVFALWLTRKNKFRELALIAGLSILLLFSWFGWAIANYGVRTTFMSNLTVSGPRIAGQIGGLRKIEINLINTAVPYFFRHVPYGDFDQPTLLGKIRDLSFCLYQTNLIFAFGSLGAVILCFALFKIRPLKNTPRSFQIFWLLFLPISALLGIAVAPVAEDWGVAHLALQPQVLLGLSVLAVLAPQLPRIGRILFLLGCFIDFLFGVLLQIHLEHRVFNLSRLANDTYEVIYDNFVLSHAAQNSVTLKAFTQVYFVGDALPEAALFFEILMILLIALILFRSALELLRPIPQSVVSRPPKQPSTPKKPKKR